MGMTGVHLVPGVDDADHWSAFEFVKLQSHLLHTGTVSERPQVIRPNQRMLRNSSAVIFLTDMVLEKNRIRKI